MKVVRFISDNKHEHQFVTALRRNINDYFKSNGLSTKANAAMVFKSIILLCLYLVPFVVLLSFNVNVFGALVLVVTMGVGLAGIGMGIMHDACHGSYARKEWVNHLLSGSLYLLGSNVLNWKIQHNVLHHTYTNIAGLDEDINSKGPIRLAERAPLKWYHRYQFIYAFIFYGLMTLSKLVNDFSQLYAYHKAGLVKSQKKKMSAEFSKMVARKLLYLVIIIGLPLWVTEYSFMQVVAGFFLMHWVAGIILSFVFQMAHVVEGAEQPVPDNNIKTDWFVHQLRTTADFARNNRLLTWYLGGLNFQVEHHLFPNICHIHYKNIAPIVEKTAREYGYVYNLQPSFGSALKSHVRRLRDLGSPLSIKH